MRPLPHLPLAALLVFGTGAAALFIADAEWLRVASATVLLAGIALGVFAIATPRALGEDPPPEELER